MLDRRKFLSTAAAMAAGNTATAWQKKPNIILVLADDLGIGNLGCYGGPFQTPHLDRLAQTGIRYTNAYTAPLCGPSRALIMTGRYAFRTGATNQDATGRMTPANETFLPAILKTAGYVSTSIGKWGQLPLGPADWGFDENLRFTGSGTYWNTQDKGKRYQVNGASKELLAKQYLPDVMHDSLMDFMTRHRSRPFFAYYSLSHIHGEILPTPDSKAGSDHYTDNIAYMDKLMGKLTAGLDRLKLRDNTLVLFAGDNGTGGNYADRATVNGQKLSGEKGSMLEGGALVPMIANWPGTVPAGKVSQDLIDSTDFVPTFAELAGAKLPSGRVLDGQSFAQRLQAKSGPARDWIFIQLASKWYVRDAAFKLDQSGQLYDMGRAPFREPAVAPESASAKTSHQRLQAALTKLNPAGGIKDDGDGSGRHANRQSKQKKRL